MSGGQSGRTSQATQQRIRVDWQELRLAHTEDGYGASARPVDDLILDALKARKEVLPAVVWIYDLEDEKANQALETKVFADEKVGLAMKRFICLKGNLEVIPNATALRELRRRAPVFYFYDPGRNLFTKLEGKRATSRSRFYGAVEKLWASSFEMRLRTFTKEMGRVLDRIDKIEGKKTVLSAKRARASGNARKEAALRKEEAELKKEEEAALELEEKTLAGCKVKGEFLPSEEAARK